MQAVHITVLEYVPSYKERRAEGWAWVVDVVRLMRVKIAPMYDGCLRVSKQLTKRAVADEERPHPPVVCSKGLVSMFEKIEAYYHTSAYL